MFIYIAWLIAAGFLYYASRQSYFIIGRHAWVGYACSAIIVGTTLLEMLGKYAG